MVKYHWSTKAGRGENTENAVVHDLPRKRAAKTASNKTPAKKATARKASAKNRKAAAKKTSGRKPRSA
ncbi:hypothetical protein [Streptomyces sp. NPDC050485]|uniref:hypothetical protein n=1 Tax=Streptomyces sp. NPDC050485 TaxID=3365617 RepID=UPI0037B0656E